jgi:hypothetical protein
VAIDGDPLVTEEAEGNQWLEVERELSDTC